MTNADRIRSMSDEELAKVIMCPKDIGASKNSICNDQCAMCSLAVEWLQQESEETENV